jgi:SNF2 family DNA or RNA helicase
MLEQKRNLAENIIGKSGETWITDLSNKELKELFTFTQEDEI